MNNFNIREVLKRLRLLAVVAGISLSAKGQLFMPAPDTVSANNFSPFAPSCLLGYYQTQQIDVADGNCMNDKLKLYYYFYAKITSTDNSLLQHIGVSSSTLSYKLSGPFNDLNEASNNFSNPSYLLEQGSSATDHTIDPATILEGKCYFLEVILDTCHTMIGNMTNNTSLVSCTPISLTCEECLGQFQPSPGNYVFSAWVKEVGAPVTKTNYTYPEVNLEVSDGVTPANFNFSPSGEIIDGWQQITGIFAVPAGMASFELSFEVSSGDALFDDIRIFPYDGSMMSYVYDPINLRLVAELDERNYAKLYEYDEEGKLVRVKKETEKGIMTIQENRENSFKKEP